MDKQYKYELVLLLPNTADISATDKRQLWSALKILAEIADTKGLVIIVLLLSMIDVT